MEERKEWKQKVYDNGWHTCGNRGEKKPAVTYPENRCKNAYFLLPFGTFPHMEPARMCMVEDEKGGFMQRVQPTQGRYENQDKY